MKLCSLISISLLNFNANNDMTFAMSIFDPETSYKSSIFSFILSKEIISISLISRSFSSKFSKSIKESFNLFTPFYNYSFSYFISFNCFSRSFVDFLFSSRIFFICEFILPISLKAFRFSFSSLFFVSNDLTYI